MNFITNCSVVKREAFVFFALLNLIYTRSAETLKLFMVTTSIKKGHFLNLISHTHSLLLSLLLLRDTFGCCRPSIVQALILTRLTSEESSDTG